MPKSKRRKPAVREPTAPYRSDVSKKYRGNTRKSQEASSGRRIAKATEPAVQSGFGAVKIGIEHKRVREGLTISLPGTSSAYLPFEVQHSLLAHLQSMLEEMCARFGKRWCPQLMENQGWIQPKSLELNCWTRAVLACDTLPEGAIMEVVGKEPKEIILAVANIRHVAVHRRAQDVTSILRSLEAAKDFAVMHQDSVIAEHISNIKAEVETILATTQAQRNILQDQLQARLKQIRTEQALLEEEAEHKARTQLEACFKEAGKKLGGFLASKIGKSALYNCRTFNSGEIFDSSDIEEILLDAERAYLSRDKRADGSE